MRLLVWTVALLLAVASWIGLVLAAVAWPRFQARGVETDVAAWTVLGALALGALLGTWGAIALRPRRRASAVAVDEFRRRRSRTPTG